MTSENQGPDLGPVLERMKKKFSSTSDQLIPLLQFVQAEMGYLPATGMKAIAEYLKIPSSHVYGVATFYSQFRFKPLGKNRITVCRGTACHVRGSGRMVEELERELGIRAGETTDDLAFSLQTVACLGSCALAPVVVINDKVYGKMTAKAAKKIINKLRAEDDKAPAKATQPAQIRQEAAPAPKPAEKPPARPAAKKTAANKAAKHKAGAASRSKPSKKGTAKAKKAAGKRTGAGGKNAPAKKKR